MQVVVGGTGANEGILVGAADGYLEGTVVGNCEGVNVGTKVGTIDTVGEDDGEYDRDGPSETEGVEVGILLGDFVGLNVG